MTIKAESTDNIAGLMAVESNRKRQAPKKRIMVPVGPTETIRHRLLMSESEFGEALGYVPNSSGYSHAKSSGEISKTVALAAEALMRRQSNSGEAADRIMMVCIVKGTPLLYDVTDSMRSIVLDGETYYMIPKSAGKR